MGRAEDWRTDRSPIEAIPSRCCGQGGAERKTGDLLAGDLLAGRGSGEDKARGRPADSKQGAADSKQGRADCDQEYGMLDSAERTGVTGQYGERGRIR
jgi:hypothetical protein